MTSRSKTFTLNNGTSRVLTGSWIDRSDWEPSSPRWMTGWFNAGQRLQPIQWNFELCKTTSKCNALTVYLIGQKALSTVLVEIARVTQNSRVSWIEIGSMLCRFRSMWMKGMPSRSSTWKIWGADLLSPGLQRVESMSKEETCHRSKLHRHSGKNLKDPQYRQSYGTKRSVKRWTSWPKKITLRHPRGPSFCVIHQIGVSSLTTRDLTNWWLPDPTIAQQFNWKIICRKQQILRFVPQRSSGRQENLVETLDTFFKLVADWSMGLERTSIESQVKATELRFDFSICCR